MRAVIQRVSEATCKVNGEITGAIEQGFLVLLGIEDADTDEDLVWLAQKIANMRVFGDENNLMNKALADIDGRIIFLYGNDTISRHTVCELKVKGKYRVFCPLFHKVFYTKQMNLASINDIQNDNLINRKISISKGFNFNEKSYYELFSRKIPYKVFNTNKKNPSTENSFGDLYFKKWYFVFGDFGLKPYMYLMYKLSHTSVSDQKRINELLFN